MPIIRNIISLFEGMNLMNEVYHRLMTHPVNQARSVQLITGHPGSMQLLYNHQKMAEFVIGATDHHKVEFRYFEDNAKNVPGLRNFAFELSMRQVVRDTLPSEASDVLDTTLANISALVDSKDRISDRVTYQY